MIGTLQSALQADSIPISLTPRLFVGREGDAQSQALIHSFSGTWIVNPRPEDGPLSSIRCALNHHPHDSGFLLWPVDHPLIRAKTVRLVLEAAGRYPEAIIAPSDGMRRGHPSFFPAWTRDELLAAPLEEGARWVLRRHPECIRHVLVEDPWIIRNINTPEILKEAAHILEQET